MDEIFEARVRRETAVPDDHELGGLTLGIKTIMQSRRIILAAKGEKKAEIIRQALGRPGDRGGSGLHSAAASEL